MFLDASAIVALAVNEPDSDALADRLDQATTPPVTSPISIFEATINYARIMQIPIDEAGERIEEFLDTLAVKTEAIVSEVGAVAIQAYRKYGRGSGHSAKLNMGDAFSYACARHYGVPLLYKGDDFSKTDLG